MTDTRVYWADWPLQVHPEGIRLFYYAEGAHYLYGMVDLIIWETRRKDFGVMVAHHVVTVALLAVSFHWGFLRVRSTRCTRTYPLQPHPPATLP